MLDARVFNGLPDHANVWIYPADRVLTPDDQTHMLESLSNFTRTWSSHGRVVVGRATIEADRFLILAAYMPEGDISGCGIDASVRMLNELARERDFAWLPPLMVLYLDDDGNVRAVSRPEFRRMARNGSVDGRTMVFDTSVKTLGELRTEGLARPAAKSWHARVFRLGQYASA